MITLVHWENKEISSRGGRKGGGGGTNTAHGSAKIPQYRIKI